MYQLDQGSSLVKQCPLKDRIWFTLHEP